MRVAYADPPYPGQSKKHYADHPDYAGEVDHGALITDLLDYDGWALSTHVSGLFLSQTVLLARGLFVNEDYRIGAWVKPFAAYKANVKWAYTWEPVIIKAARPPEPNRIPGLPCRDHIAEGITMKRGLSGAKPTKFCWWLFEALGLDPADDFVDLFPGSGAVTDAHATWKRSLGQMSLRMAA
jgi:hypothetical protein